MAKSSQFLDNKKYIILDTHSTGLEPRQDRLFQLCYAVFENGVRNKFVISQCSDIDVPADYSMFSGDRSPEDILSGGVDLFLIADTKEVISSFLKDVKGVDFVVCYSSSYHLQLLGSNAKRVGLNVPNLYVIDPFVIFSSSYQYNKGKKLTDAFDKYNINCTQDATLDEDSLQIKKNVIGMNYLIHQMFKDDNCKYFHPKNSEAEDVFESLTQKQLLSAILKHNSLKDYFKKQANGKAPNWRPWYPAPDGKSHIASNIDMPFGNSPEVLEVYCDDPEIESDSVLINFSGVLSKRLYPVLLMGIMSTRQQPATCTISERDDSQMVAFLENGILHVELTDEINSVVDTIKELDKWPLTMLGVGEQFFDVISSERVKSDIMKVYLKLFRRKCST